MLARDVVERKREGGRSGVDVVRLRGRCLGVAVVREAVLSPMHRGRDRPPSGKGRQQDEGENGVRATHDGAKAGAAIGSLKLPRPTRRRWSAFQRLPDGLAAEA